MFLAPFTSAGPSLHCVIKIFNDLLLVICLSGLFFSSVLLGYSRSKLLTDAFLNLCPPWAFRTPHCSLFILAYWWIILKFTTELEKGQRKVAPDWPFVLWVKNCNVRRYCKIRDLRCVVELVSGGRRFAACY